MATVAWSQATAICYIAKRFVLCEWLPARSAPVRRTNGNERLCAAAVLCMDRAGLRLCKEVAYRSAEIYAAGKTAPLVNQENAGRGLVSSAAKPPVR
jgi:hypothetical protein